MEENLKEVAEGKKERLKEHIDDLKENMTIQPPKFPEPIHQNFFTFQKYEKKWKGKGKNRKITGPVRKENKEPHFGKAKRFPKT
jgi:hypothetical protein